jgi:hypothetical protein
MKKGEEKLEKEWEERHNLEVEEILIFNKRLSRLMMRLDKEDKDSVEVHLPLNLV